MRVKMDSRVISGALKSKMKPTSIPYLVGNEI